MGLVVDYLFPQDRELRYCVIDSTCPESVVLGRLVRRCSLCLVPDVLLRGKRSKLIEQQKIPSRQAQV